MYSVNDSATNCTGFPHSDIVGYNGSYHLTDAFRRLARPSSPLTARASTVYAWSLNLTTRSSFCFVLQVFERLWHGIIISCFGEMRRHAVSIFSLFRIVKEQILRNTHRVYSEVLWARTFHLRTKQVASLRGFEPLLPP